MTIITVQKIVGEYGSVDDKAQAEIERKKLDEILRFYNPEDSFNRAFLWLGPNQTNFNRNFFEYRFIIFA